MNLFELGFKELTELLKSRYNKGEYHARALLREVIKKGDQDIEKIPAFAKSPRLYAALKSNGDLQSLLPLPNVIDQVEENSTIKFITRLRDNHHIESVIIPMKQYNTLCVSTQAGCRMGCIFCQTAASGFQRNLTVSEITAQLFAARFILKKEIKNIVFMGMGEPLDNMEAVIRAIGVFNQPHGFDIALRHMTLSTCGVIPGIDQLGQLNLSQLNLAVSLNTADNQLRSRLMPINRKYPLMQLKHALLNYPLAARRLILVEYILFKGLNDSQEDAQKLASYLGGLKVRINLIGFNPGPEQGEKTFSHKKSEKFDEYTDQEGCEAAAIKKNSKVEPLTLLPAEDEDIHRFASLLEAHGLSVVKRWGKGRELQAGCGQLSANR